MDRRPVILLVEDDEDTISLTTNAIEACGIRHELVVTRDGVEALDYLHGHGKYEGRDPGDCPELVLCDLGLPRRNGVEVVREARLNPYTEVMPIVMLSDSQNMTHIRAAFRAGANSFVRKVSSQKELRERIMLICSFWLTLNERCCSTEEAPGVQAAKRVVKQLEPPEQ